MCDFNFCIDLFSKTRLKSSESSRKSVCNINTQIFNTRVLKNQSTNNFYFNKYFTLA